MQFCRRSYDPNIYEGNCECGTVGYEAAAVWQSHESNDLRGQVEQEDQEGQAVLTEPGTEHQVKAAPRASVTQDELEEQEEQEEKWRHAEQEVLTRLGLLQHQPEAAPAASATAPPNRRRHRQQHDQPE